ncbi:MAG: phospholipase D-like domain-containing protein [Methylococcales bacterium]|nr:phospholipase D-like domain-containing protein [Methylococcales bacterium]
MQLIAGKLNNQWLENILQGSIEKADWVKAAIAYASGDPKLINICFKHNIRLEYWGRYDCSVPVATTILKKIISKNSPNYVCKLVPDIFHPKVIWWGGYGALIGSANLTDRAWYGNIECGLFLTESELINNGMDLELERFFEGIDEYSHPLTQEVIDELEDFDRKQHVLLNQLEGLKDSLGRKRSIPVLASLVSVDKIKTEDRLRASFLKEWNATLQILRNISEQVSLDENRPDWVAANTAKGIQADQFLHAYYYSYIRDGNKHPYMEYFERHKSNPEMATKQAISWWKSLDKPPTSEGEIIKEWAPFNQKSLEIENLKNWSLENLTQVCSRVHAIRDNSLRVDNQTYGLSKDTKQKSQEECIELLAKFLWNKHSDSEKSIVEVITYVLYGGAEKDVPIRLWDATHDDKWRIPHLGLSTLGELVGWAKPNMFPPRNGRTSKALTALGHKVKIHSG